jgi:hypothetical protein
MPFILQVKLSKANKKRIIIKRDKLGKILSSRIPVLPE